jgi:hypothetical protein
MKTLKTLIAERGIDERHAVTLMNRRARYAMARDRPKVFADTDVGEYFYFLRTRSLRHYSAEEGRIQQDFTSLRIPDSTAQYVAAWCRLNHLMEC